MTRRSVSSLYGLGTYSRRLREAGRIRRSNRHRPVPRRACRGGQTVSPFLTALRAVADAGFSLRHCLSSSTTDRSARADGSPATRALRSMPDAKVDELLVATLKTDRPRAVAHVRARFRPGRRSTTCSREASPRPPRQRWFQRIGYRAVQLLIKVAAERPELRLSLEHVAKATKRSKSASARRPPFREDPDEIENDPAPVEYFGARPLSCPVADTVASELALAAPCGFENSFGDCRCASAVPRGLPRLRPVYVTIS